jgi:16S rRNA (cytosine1402-N4)-methyltransferase
LDQIEPAIREAVRRLGTSHRIGVISFHSLEDRLVKSTFASLCGACTCPRGMPVCGCGAVALVRMVTRKPLVASDEEIRQNPRARSSQLRVAERT